MNMLPQAIKIAPITQRNICSVGEAGEYAPSFFGFMIAGTVDELSVRQVERARSAASFYPFPFLLLIVLEKCFARQRGSIGMVAGVVSQIAFIGIIAAELTYCTPALLRTAKQLLQAAVQVVC